MTTIGEGWEAWVGHMTQDYGPPPPNALPLLKMTYYMGALQILNSIATRGVTINELATEIRNEARLESFQPSELPQA